MEFWQKRENPARARRLRNIRSSCCSSLSQPIPPTRDWVSASKALPVTSLRSLPRQWRLFKRHVASECWGPLRNSIWHRQLRGDSSWVAIREGTADRTMGAGVFLRPSFFGPRSLSKELFVSIDLRENSVDDASE